MIDLTHAERDELQAIVRRRTAQQRMVLRARIVLAAAEDEENASIAERLEVALNTVIKWRKRFFEERASGLSDRKRSGRPRTFPPLVHAEAKALACELPATTGVPLSKWSCAELARELVARAVVEAISPATVWRILDRDAIRPWLAPLVDLPQRPRLRPKGRRRVGPLRQGVRGNSAH